MICLPCRDHRHFNCVNHRVPDWGCDCDTCNQIREDALQDKLEGKSDD